MEVPALKTDALNINDTKVVTALLATFSGFISDRGHYRSLKVKNGVYFSTSPEVLPSEAGWYVIVVAGHPLYVGEADNLNGRLNSDNGSRDNFLNSQRASDPERNVIKKLFDSGYFPDLKVWFVTEREFSSRVGCNLPLSSLDRGNIEKLLNISRGEIQEWMSSHK